MCDQGSWAVCWDSRVLWGLCGRYRGSTGPDQTPPSSCCTASPAVHFQSARCPETNTAAQATTRGSSVTRNPEQAPGGGTCGGHVCVCASSLLSAPWCQTQCAKAPPCSPSLWLGGYTGHTPNPGDCPHGRVVALGTPAATDTGPTRPGHACPLQPATSLPVGPAVPSKCLGFRVRTEELDQAHDLWIRSKGGRSRAQCTLPLQDLQRRLRSEAGTVSVTAPVPPTFVQHPMPCTVPGTGRRRGHPCSPVLTVQQRNRA